MDATLAGVGHVDVVETHRVVRQARERGGLVQNRAVEAIGNGAQNAVKLANEIGQALARNGTIAIVLHHLEVLRECVAGNGRELAGDEDALHCHSSGGNLRA